jgi:hypothetical protein
MTTPRDLPPELEPVRDYLEGLKPFDESLESILGDQTQVTINAPRALIVVAFKSFVFSLAQGVRDGRVKLV